MKLNIVPARTGIQWVKLGIQTFFRQPLALAGLFFMYVVAVVLLSAIPFIGPLVGGLVVPAFWLGFMVATEEATKGRFPMPSVLVSAFRVGRQRARAMLVLGVIYAVASQLATIIGGALGGPPAPTPPGGPPQMGTGTAIALLLHLPLYIVFWHAPALVHWHGVSPGKSLFFSTVACFRNLAALLVYGLMWSGVFLAAAFLLGTLGLVFGGEMLARSVMLPTALLMAAMFSASIYFTFRDSFVATPADVPADLPSNEPPTGGDTP